MSLGKTVFASVCVVCLTIFACFSLYVDAELRIQKAKLRMKNDSAHRYISCVNSFNDEAKKLKAKGEVMDMRRVEDYCTGF